MALQFNTNQIKGSALLSIIILIILGIKYLFINYYSIENITFDDVQLQQEYLKLVEESKMDINKITEKELMDLGLYKNQVEKIIQYRERLGGFINIDQLKEIKGINMESIDAIKDFIFVEENFKPKKIKINIVKFKEIIQHPYFDYETVKYICNYRKFNKINNFDFLIENQVMDNEKDQKLKLYIDFN